MVEGLQGKITHGIKGIPEADLVSHYPDGYEG
jgi:hypothetical protein